MQLRKRLFCVSFMLDSRLPFTIRVFSKPHTWSKTHITQASASTSANRTVKRCAEAAPEACRGSLVETSKLQDPHSFHAHIATHWTWLPKLNYQNTLKTAFLSLEPISGKWRRIRGQTKQWFWNYSLDSLLNVTGRAANRFPKWVSSGLRETGLNGVILPNNWKWLVVI